MMKGERQRSSMARWLRIIMRRHERRGERARSIGGTWASLRAW